MKVILLRDVAKLGKRFSIAEVPDGYALNKLIPSGLAEAATPINLKRVNERTGKVQASKDTELSTFADTLAALKDLMVEVPAEANAQDHLFQSIKTTDIAAALAALGHAVPVSAITLTEPIKSLGEFSVPLTMEPKSGSVTIKIVRK
jgi:large subunit ribosomal protein L9